MEYNSLSDEALVKIIQEGNILYFEILVKRYQNKLLSFVKRIVFDEAASEEIVQDAYLKIYKTIDRIDTGRTFSSYIFTIARNCAVSYLRSRKKEIPLKEELEIGIPDDTLENLIRQDESHRISNILAKLEDKYRIVIKLYYFDNLSYEEISLKLRLPINTIRTHLRRAKEVLKEKLR